MKHPYYRATTLCPKLKLTALLFFIFSFFHFQSLAQLSLENGTTNYTIDLDATQAGVNNGAFAGSGLAPTPSAGQLDGDAWEVYVFSEGDHDFGGTNTSGDFARGNSSGAIGTGGLYAFETSSGNFSMGVQPGGSSFTPGHFPLKITNDRTTTITSFNLSYTVYVYNDQDRANSFNFSHSTDNSSFTNEASLDLVSPEAESGSPTWVPNMRSIEITGLSIAPGADYYLKWTGDDVSGGGSRDQFGLDDIALVVPSAPTSAPFITTWKTDNPGTSNSTSITIPTTGSGYNYDVDWDNDGTFDQTGITGDVTHDFGTAGTYTIRIQGDFPRIYFNFSGDRQKILSIDQWGGIAWSSMENAFYGASNLTYTATDAPDLSMVTSMSGMFAGATSFNGDLSNWNVSSVMDMPFMFSEATSFNSDLNNWNVSNVTNMNGMFISATSFNSDLNNWDVSNVANMFRMFRGATSFNGNVSTWNISGVTDIREVFREASSFNGDLSNWDVSNITDMERMFRDATSFNGNLSTWNVTGVSNMKEMFFGANSFNADLSNWIVSNVTNMFFMFSGATSFNSDLSNWNVSNVMDMSAMFFGATSFNRDLSNWNVSNVMSMGSMFLGASSFNQSLGNWNVSAADMENMLSNSSLDITNYDNTLIGWNNQGIANRDLGASGLEYCNGQTEQDLYCCLF